MPVRHTTHVEPVGIRKLRGIAVRRADAQVDRRARLHGNAADLGVLHHHAVAKLHGRIEAQHLVDRRADQRRIVQQALPLVRTFEKQIQPVADEIGRRLVAGIENEDAVLQKLTLGETLAA